MAQQSGKRVTADFKNRNEGEIFFDSRGIRYKYVGGQSRQMCVGDNNTCPSIRHSGNLCSGHQTGFKKYGTNGLVRGNIVIRNGQRRLFNGTQLRQLCSVSNCNIVVTKDGRCKKHSPHWHCKFTGEQCHKIRVDGTDYCALHRDNKQQQRVKSKKEKMIADWLDARDIKYLNNQHVEFENTTMYPDFILTELNVAIEYDGKQHFQNVDYWGGEDGLAQRVIADARKDRWAHENMRAMLRISHKDVERMGELLDTFIEIVPMLDDGNNIVATDFEGYAGRNYVVI